jgi:S1-C subfamily serine protease
MTPRSGIGWSQSATHSVAAARDRRDHLRTRRDINEGPYDDFLQIDAPINRGNSGGPTFNLRGQVIGINTAIYSPSGGSVGIGFAVPSNIAKQVVTQLRSTAT